jgi:drug/metabolite transporter (DMT)-like permease
MYRTHLAANIGLLFIVLSQFFNSIMVTTTKLLVTDEDPIHPLQILFVRMLITALGCVLYLKYYKKEAQLWGPKELRWLLVLRGVMGFIGVFAMYYSLMYLSVSEATVITFLVPSMTGFLAWVLLRERWSLIEALGSVISLFGVMLIARPSFLFGTTDDGANGAAAERLTATMVALVGVCGASMVYIVIRFIGKRVHSLVMVNFFATTTLIVSFLGLILIPHLGFKVPKNGKQWFLFFALGISGFFMQFLLTEGIQREKASRASMMLYSQMLYSVMWEITIWHKLPGFWSWCGIVIILGAAFVVVKNKPNEPVKLNTEGEQAAEIEFDISMDDDVTNSEVDVTVDKTPAQSPT